ncbi:MAG: tetratricopeptide repeat protein [Planctomycetes bacterium]|jgi:serine/threonine-protein kinase|nr:tetratricopeptide repeat protein [Planctomycetota bacterium]MCU0725023.1 tetratricopeptide repeat protein [Planctomycetota bacterium]
MGEPTSGGAGPEGGPGPSILESIAARSGVEPRLLLHDDPHEASPLLRVKAGDEEAVPDDRRYVVAGEIGEGGVGVVYKARDRDLGRDVALKVLRRSLAIRDDILQRFVEEAQIGGQLQHPGIVPVYGLGLTPDGRPFFTMKLVRGQTLAAALEARGAPGEDLPRFVRLFERICQAMAYAHARGVLHRDLKPSNILLGRFGESYIVDWGFGKVLGRSEPAAPETSETEHTIVTTVRTGSSGSASLTGSVMGTPAYMPPEQALGRVEELDARSDVFSLGAILAEILTGEPPYVGERKELLLMASQARLEEAWARLAGCGADPALVDLARRCLDPRPSNRPESAGALVAALSAHFAEVRRRAEEAELAAVEERARLDRATDHARWERRAKQRTLAAAAAVILVVLSGGGLSLRHAAKARERVAALRPKVDEAMQEAALLAAEGRLDEAYLAAEKARRLAGGADEATAARAERLLRETSAGLARARAEAERAAHSQAFLDRLAEAAFGRAGEYDSAVVPAAYAAAFTEEGLDPRAADPVAVAEALRARGKDFAREVALALDDWAAAILGSSRSTGDVPKILTAAKLADPDPWRCRLRDAAATGEAAELRRLADEADFARVPARSILLLGKGLSGSKESGSAAGLLRRLHLEDPGNVTVLTALSNECWRLHPVDGEGGIRFGTAALALAPLSPRLLRWVCNFAGGDGLPSARASLEALRRLPQHPDTLRLEASILLEEGCPDEALACCDEALRQDPGHLHALYGKGTALDALGRSEEAIALLLASEKSPDCTCRQRALGAACFSAGRYDEAIAAFREVLELNAFDSATRNRLVSTLAIIERTEEAARIAREGIALDPADPQYFGNLWPALFELGRPDEALVAAREAVRLAPENGTTHAWLGAALLQTGREEEGRACLRRAVEIDPESTQALLVAAAAHAGQGAIGEATGLIRRALALRVFDLSGVLGLCVMLDGPDLREDVLGLFRAIAEMRPTAQSLERLADALAARDKWGEAEEVYRMALELAPGSAWLPVKLGISLARSGRTDEAFELLAKEAAANPRDARPLNALGLAHLVAGRIDEAIADYRRALELDPRLAAAHENLAEALYAKEAFAESEAHSRKALELTPTSTRALSMLGGALVQQGQLEEALEFLRRAIALEPGVPSHYGNLGRLLLALQRPAEAAEAFRKLLSIGPPDAVVAADLGRALLESDRPAEALGPLRAAVSAMPADPDLRLDLSRALLLDGRPAEAVEEAREAERIAPRHPAPLFMLALGLSHSGHLDSAIEVLQRLIPLIPDPAELQGMLGGYLFGAGRIEEALSALRVALQGAPDDPAALGTLSATLVAAGQFAEAVEPARKSAALVATDPLMAPEAARHLARCEALARDGERIAAIAAGKAPPRDAADAVLAAWLADQRSLSAAAAALYAEAFRRDPSLLAGTGTGDVLPAAACAVIVGTGRAPDAGRLDEPARAAWRTQALAWLRLDLDAHRTSPRPFSDLTQNAFAFVREEEFLATLPAAEREAWAKFWADARAAAARTGGGK